MKPTFEPSPMPTQTMNSGSIASGGIGRSSSTTGSTTLRTARTWPARVPARARRAAQAPLHHLRHAAEEHGGQSSTSPVEPVNVPAPQAERDGGAGGMIPAEETTHGHIRRLHRRRQHGQSDGGQRAE